MGYQFGGYILNASHSFNTGHSPYHGNVHCRGDEYTIWDCDMDHDVSVTGSECDSNDAVFLSCVRFSYDVPSIFSLSVSHFLLLFCSAGKTTTADPDIQKFAFAQ